MSENLPILTRVARSIPYARAGHTADIIAAVLAVVADDLEERCECIPGEPGECGPCTYAAHLRVGPEPPAKPEDQCSVPLFGDLACIRQAGHEGEHESPPRVVARLY